MSFQDPSVPKSQRRLRPLSREDEAELNSFSEARRKIILEGLDTRVPRLYIHYFKVLKEIRRVRDKDIFLARIIASCKGINDLFARPPKLLLRTLRLSSSSWPFSRIVTSHPWISVAGFTSFLCQVLCARFSLSWGRARIYFIWRCGRWVFHGLLGYLHGCNL